MPWPGIFKMSMTPNLPASLARMPEDKGWASCRESRCSSPSTTSGELPHCQEDQGARRLDRAGQQIMRDKIIAALADLRLPALTYWQLALSAMTVRRRPD